MSRNAGKSKQQGTSTDEIDRILFPLEHPDEVSRAPSLPTRDDLKSITRDAYDGWAMARSASSPEFGEGQGLDASGSMKKSKYPAVIRTIPFKITIVGARGLRNADVFTGGSGLSDPYCICQIPGRPKAKFQTKTINDNVNPNWNHEGDLEFIAGDSLRFTVYDKDWCNKELLGDITLPWTTFYPQGFSGDVELQNSGKSIKDIKSAKDFKTILKLKIEIVYQSKRPMMQRGFGVSLRPPIYSGGADNELGPGTYDTHNVGAYLWDRNADVSHPSQKQLSLHRSPPLTSFGKPKTASTHSLLAQPPGPGHYNKPDLWDPSWQRYPRAGVSLTRQLLQPTESRFGALAHSLVKDTKGGEMDGLLRN